MADKSKMRRERELQQKRTIAQVQADVKKLRTGEMDDVEVLAATDGLRQQLDRNHKKIKSTAIANQDAETFKHVSHSYSEYVKKGARDSRRIDASAFMAKLKERFNKPDKEDDELGWQQLGRAANGFFCGVFDNGFLAGTLEVQRKEKKARKAVEKKQKHALERPEDMKKSAGGEKAEKTHHEKMQQQLHALLDHKYKSGVGMLELLVNPESFTQTVENFFEYSFFVGDTAEGGSKIELEDGVPVLRPLSKEEAQIGSNSKNAAHQSILSFDMGDWEKAKEMLALDKPLVPTRKDAVYKGCH